MSCLRSEDIKVSCIFDYFSITKATNHVNREEFKDLHLYLSKHSHQWLGITTTACALFTSGYPEEAIKVYEMVNSPESHLAIVDIIDGILSQNDTNAMHLSEEEVSLYNQKKFYHLTHTNEHNYTDKMLCTLRGLPWNDDGIIHNAGIDLETIMKFIKIEKDLKTRIRELENKK